MPSATLPEPIVTSSTPSSGSSLWHAFADMSKVPATRVVLDRGEGAWIWDTQGRRYLDSTAGLWYCALGWGRTELAHAAAEQMTRLATYSTFGDMTTNRTLELAERVASLSPMPHTAVFLTSGGSESIDTAAKIVRRYWNVVGRPEKRVIVSRANAYHGIAGFGTSIAGISLNRDGYGPLIEDVCIVHADSTAELQQLFEERGHEIAAFFGEPVRGAGGLYPPVEGYWPEVERLCRQHDVLLVCDEVITGFGRMGQWFASAHYGIQPDIITGAKAITSGYQPLGVVLCNERVQEPFFSGKAGVLRHGYTYSGHATACAVGLKALEIMEQENIIARGAETALAMQSLFEPLRRHPMVKEIRTAGLLAGTELTAKARKLAPNVVDQIVWEARKHEVMSRNLLGHSLQFSPALIISLDEIRFYVERMIASLDAVGARLA
jgi:adenosylmethionine-8-amino-7-oxononanoate aminotransferase